MEVNMCDKVCYSQKEAGRVVNSLHKRRRDNNRKSYWSSKIPARYYFCKECNAYHLTSLNHYEEWENEGVSCGKNT